MNIQQQLDGNQSRRMAAQNRHLKTWDELNNREDEAEEMLGQLMRDGKIVYYVMPKGGKYREGSRLDLIAFLVRNNYV
jgi:hypothetical protein